MKLSAILLLLILVSPAFALASVNVEISGNGPGAQSEVNIENHVNSSTTNSKTSRNQIDIRIETNGEVKEYHGTDKSVQLKSDNGNNSVSVLSNDNSIKNIDKVDSSGSASFSANLDIQEDEDKPFNLLEIIKRELESFLNIFRN